MKTKDEILATKYWSGEYPNYMQESEVKDAMSEYAQAFAEWLSRQTTVVYEEKITLYRYCDRNNECGNYTLADIYIVFCDEMEKG